MSTLNKKLQRLLDSRTAYEMRADERAKYLDAIIEKVGTVTFTIGDEHCFRYSGKFGLEKAGKAARQAFWQLGIFPSWVDDQAGIMKEAYITASRLPHILKAIEEKIDETLAIYANAEEPDRLIAAMASCLHQEEGNPC